MVLQRKRDVTIPLIYSITEKNFSCPVGRKYHLT